MMNAYDPSYWLILKSNYFLRSI